MLLKVILESNVTPNISRSTDSFSTVSPVVKKGVTGEAFIVHDVVTILVSVLFTFSFIPRAHPTH